MGSRLSNLGKAIVSALRSGAEVKEITTSGYGQFSQNDLPGDRTVVVKQGNSDIFFPVSDSTVYIPKAYDEQGVVGPDDSTAIINLLARDTEYDVEQKRILNI